MKSINLPQLNDLRIASPCSMDWESMTGTDQVRHCSQCKLNVYNLSNMTTRDAQDLIARTEGNVCVRMFQRADGTVITQDCPVGLAAARATLARVACRFGALAATLLAAAVLGKSHNRFEDNSGLTSNDPFYSIASIFGRAHSSSQFMMGRTSIHLGPPPPSSKPGITNLWGIFQ